MYNWIVFHPLTQPSRVNWSLLFHASVEHQNRISADFVKKTEDGCANHSKCSLSWSRYAGVEDFVNKEKVKSNPTTKWWGRNLYGILKAKGRYSQSSLWFRMVSQLFLRKPRMIPCYFRGWQASILESHLTLLDQCAASVCQLFQASGCQSKRTPTYHPPQKKIQRNSES